MKFQIRSLILLSMILCLPLAHAHVAGKKVEVLTDRQMASVEGGFCLIEKCETGAPSGNFQTFPPTFAGLCLPRTCLFEEFPSALGMVKVCRLAGQYTCTGGGYRKCITGKLWDLCWYSSINVCGTNVEPFCAEDPREGTCLCGVRDTAEACDWTNCDP
jgi:hypothetical protein